MSTPLVLRYPLDLTGTSADNLVVDETHTLPNRLTRAIAPYSGPFYTESVKVYDIQTNEELVRGMDFHCVEYYEIPSRMSGKEVCAIILLVQPNQSQEVRIQYQAVGGEFSYSIDAVVRMIETINRDDRPVHWPNIIDIPPSFTPAPHLHDIGDTYGWEYIVQSLENIRQAILMGDSASHDEIFAYIDRVVDDINELIDTLGDDLTDHKNDFENPHQTTKAQVGLGSVQNLPLANEQVAKVGESNSHYMTPVRTKDAIDALIRPELNAHLADENNPHNVTKAQVGLSNIPNSITASRNTNSNESLLTAKALYDHIRSSDHDDRYVRKGDAVDGSIRVTGGKAQVFINNAWRQFYPPLWT